MPSLTFSSSFFSPFHAHQRQPPQQQQQLLDDIFADVDLAERDEDEEEEEKLETGTRDADGTKKKNAKEDLDYDTNQLIQANNRYWYVEKCD